MSWTHSCTLLYSSSDYFSGHASHRSQSNLSHISPCLNCYIV
jgi:hypothetical protein